MAREIVTHIWCDLCLANDDVHTEAVETPPITLGTMKPRVLALCDVHTKEVYEPLRELLAELGQVHDPAALRVPGTSPGSGVWPCPDPNCHKHTKPFKHDQSLRNHARRVHSMSINDLRALHPEGAAAAAAAVAGNDDTLFAPDEAKAPKVTRAACDQDGCTTVYEWPTYKKPVQALGVHKARAHGIRGAKSSGRRGEA